MAGPCGGGCAAFALPSCAGATHALDLARSNSTTNPAGSGSGLGFCRGYSFNMGDLTTCGDVLVNYLEAYDTIPWYNWGCIERPHARLGVHTQSLLAAAAALPQNQ